MLQTGLTKTNLVRGVVMMVEKDILVNRAQKPLRDLRELAAVTGINA